MVRGPFTATSLAMLARAAARRDSWSFANWTAVGLAAQNGVLALDAACAETALPALLAAAGLPAPVAPVAASPLCGASARAARIPNMTMFPRMEEPPGYP